jgi:two-component sensor histidine kinase
MKLIRSFSEQLGGDYDLAGDGGLSYTLRFQAG